MNFGSDYVFTYAKSESESVSGDDDDGRLDVNDVDLLFIPQIPSSDEGKHQEKQIVSTSDKPAVVSHKRKRLRKADTNVLSVKFNQLLQPGEMHAGDPVYCHECGAIASHLSKISVEKKENITEEVAADGTESKWHCEFCPHINTVDIEQTDLPKQEDATYLISPASVVHGSDMSGVDDSIVFFLIDISGSMSSTTLVHGQVNLPNALKQQERAAEAFGGAPMIRQRHQTYVTRLQGVQMAVVANLDKIVKDTPTKRAALLTFNHEITYYGDGTKDEPLVIRGDKLNSTDDLLHEAERELNNELKPVAQTKAKLTERVYNLEEGGQTALGPAVVFALNIASRRQGSKIVICTDGLANRGLGSLETAQDEKVDEAIRMQALGEGNQFYADLTERARDKGVSISVITIKGTSCLLPVIGQMADGTGSNVTIVDLLNMRDEFASILEQQVIATNVEATLVVHRGLYIRNPDNPEEKLDKIKRTIGNVTKQTEVTFEFGVRNKQEIKEKYHIDLDRLEQLPFQVQVTYTTSDGNKALRVLTQLKKTTENREIAEVNAVRSVIAENHIRSTANDMMAAISDEEDDGLRDHSKWSTPVVQKQRLAYMDNLSSKVRSRDAHRTDQFNERRWNKASSVLQAQCLTSKSRRSDALKSRIAPSLPPSSSMLDDTRGGAPRLFLGSKKDEEVSERRVVVSSITPKNTPKRSYGFTTSKCSYISDQHSEDLYRYKNISSDYMRETSPTREDDQPAVTLDDDRFATRRTEHGDRRSIASDDRRHVSKSVQSDVHRGELPGTGRFATRQRGDDNPTATASNTRRLRTSEKNADDQPSKIVATGRFSTKRNENDTQPTIESSISRFETRQNDDSNQVVSFSDAPRLVSRQNDNADSQVEASNTDHLTDKRNSNDDAKQQVAESSVDREESERNEHDANRLQPNRIMANLDTHVSVEHDVNNLLNDLIDQIHLMSTLCDNVSIKLEPRYRPKLKKTQTRSMMAKQKKRRIFSSSEDDSSSSSDESFLSEDKNTLINENSDSESDEQKALHNRHGPRTRNELAVDDLPPIENLTITLSEETPIERIGHVRHIIDGKLVIIESLLHSPALNDDSVLFNRERRSIGLIFETFGPVEKPYYSIRYNDINNIHQRQIELNQDVFYAPKETTYTKYVFVQELRALKGSDASWEDDNEPPRFAIDYSDDEQERTAKAIQRGKRNLEEITDEPSMDTAVNPTNIFSSNYSNLERSRGRGRGHHRGFRNSGVDNRPAPSLPNWFQNTSAATSFQHRSAAPQSSWQNNSNTNSAVFSSFNVPNASNNNPGVRPVQQPPPPPPFQDTNSTHSVFPWM